MRCAGALLACCIGWCAQGQKIAFVPHLDARPVALGVPSAMPNVPEIIVSTFKCYVGHFTCYGKGQVVSTSEVYHLLDASDSTSLQFNLDAHGADSISFLLGVDSLTNVSGAFGGDLDPIHGMYWAWNSGYINLKLECTTPVSPYPSHAVELHLGGYLPPHATAERIGLALDGAGPWTVSVDLLPLLAAAELNKRCNVMSPGERAVQLSHVAATMFTLHAAQ